MMGPRLGREGVWMGENENWLAGERTKERNEGTKGDLELDEVAKERGGGRTVRRNLTARRLWRAGQRGTSIYFYEP